MLRHHRPVLYLAALATSVMAVTPPVEAGGLCDWLFGNRTAAYPAAPPAYSANYAPVYAAGYAPIATATAPTAAPLTAYRPTLNGAAAAQMPAYVPPATATPNGYTGIYSSYYGANPVATRAPAPTSSFYGTGNIYPDPLQRSSNAVATTNYAPSNAPAYATNYATNYAPSYATNNAAAYASYYAPPSNAMIAPARRPGLLGGVRRFFGALFGKGTGYQTSYYRAPVTYYRPITTVDPTSGATVTSQRACTGSQYQIQRSPIRSYQGVQTPQAAPYNNGCGSEAPFPNTTLPANPAGEGYVPQPTLPANGFDPYATQRSTYGNAGSNPPASSYRSYPSYPADNTAPLSGTPSNGARNGGSQGDASAPDQRTVPQPQLDPNSSTLRGYRRMPENAASTNRSGWRSASPKASRPAPLTPRRKARPIPAPPSLWPVEERSRSADGQEVGGRTAARPTWGSKKIEWASHRQPTAMASPNTAPPNTAAANRASAGRLIAEPTAAADAAVRRVDHVAPAPQPPRARPAHAPAPRPRYDDSGWE